MYQLDEMEVVTYYNCQTAQEEVYLVFPESEMKNPTYLAVKVQEVKDSDLMDAYWDTKYPQD